MGNDFKRGRPIAIGEQVVPRHARADTAPFICLLVIYLQIVVPRCLGQVTYQDLEAGYRENLARLSERPLELRWSIQRQVPAATSTLWSESREALANLVEHEQNPDLKRDLSARLSVLARDLDGVPARAYQIFWSDQGMRLRTMPGHLDQFPENESERYPVDLLSHIQATLIPISSQFSGPELTTLAFTTITYKFDEPWMVGTALSPSHESGKSKAFNVVSADLHRFATDDMSPVPYFGKRDLIHDRSFLDLIYPPAPSDVRLTAEYRIEIKGNIAELTIEEHPERLGVAPQYGRRIFAEIELTKGFLPRLVKGTAFMTYKGQRLDERYGDLWPSEITFEIEKYGEGFYPKKITHRDMREDESSSAWLAKEVRRVKLQFPIEEEWGTPSRNLIEDYTKVWDVELRPWSGPNKDFFSYDAPSDADVVLDQRSGKVLQNKKVSAQLLLDLSEIPDVPGVDLRPVSVLSRWPVWLALTVLALVSLMIAHRAGRKASRSDDAASAK